MTPETAEQLTHPSSAAEGYTWQILRWCPTEWPPRERELLQSFPIKDNHLLQLGFTPGGNLVILRLNAEGLVLQTLQSQPMEFEGEGLVRIGIHWGREGMRCRFGSHDLSSLHECSDPARIVFAAKEEWPIKSYEASERHAACEREVRLRSNRTHASGSGDRALSLQEEIENLRDSVRALGEDAQRVRAGEKHRANAMRAAIRALVSDLGNSYSPSLLRVAGYLDLPLPIYAIPKGFLKALQATNGFTSDAASCTKSFETQRLIDFSEWLRRPMLVQESQKKPYTFDEVIARSANFLGGAHSPSAIPPEIDGIARVTIGGLSANTRFLLSVAEVVVELGQCMLRAIDTPVAERCTERRAVPAPQ